MSEALFRCTVPGRPIVKKNTQRTVGFGKARHVIYSQRYMAWELVAIAACKRAFNTALITCPLEAQFRFYFADCQAEPDTSNLIEGIQDVLQTASIIKDDKQIFRLGAEKFLFQEPRTEVELFKLVRVA